MRLSVCLDTFVGAPGGVQAQRHVSVTTRASSSEVQVTTAGNSEPTSTESTAEIWELDFCSRPIMDERKKKVRRQYALKRRFLGGRVFRGGKRSLAFPIKHKVLPSQQNSVRICHVTRLSFHPKHRFHYVFHCDHLWCKLPEITSLTHAHTHIHKLRDFDLFVLLFRKGTNSYSL